MHAREDNPTGWQLFTFGDFQLLDPAGVEVSLPHRKVEALLAVLAVNRQGGIERDELAEILWPGRPTEKQGANLRQVISLLRKALGQESLDVSRSHLRLSSSLNLQCDYDTPPSGGASVFMPGHEGDWFEEIRLERPAVHSPLVVRSVVGNFQESVEMLALADPRGSFDLLRTQTSMTKGLPNPVLRSLLHGFGNLEIAKGWIDFWMGTLADDLHEAISLLRSAMREAKRTRDYELASETCLELGKAYCRTGNLAKADKICNIAENLADLMKTRAARASADRLRGTYMVHWQDSQAGLLLLQKAEDSTDDVVGRTHLTAAHAFFAASAGDNRKAGDLLSGLAKTAPILGEGATLVLMGLSRAILTISGGQPTNAVPELEKISRWSKESEVTQIGVYAEELLMRIYDRSGDTTLSRSRMASAHLGRQKAQMLRTPIEARRLTYVQ